MKSMYIIELVCVDGDDMINVENSGGGSFE